MTPAPSLRSAPRRFCAPLVLAATLGLAACRPGPAQSTAVAAPPVATPVQTARVEAGPVTGELLLSGDVEALDDVGLSPELGGKVARLFVKVGERVKAGQTLAVLDTRSARLREAQAAAAEALALANAESAGRELKRIEGLGESIAQQAIDKARDGAALGQAQLAQARAALEVARDALRVSAVLSPIAGVVAAVNAEAGETWSPSSPVPMVRVINQAEVDVRVWVPSSRIAGLVAGGPAGIELDAYPGRRFEARVNLVDPAADPRSRSFGVEVRAQNPEGVLRAGMPARVRLPLPARAGALRVPRAALLEDSSGAALFVVEAGRAARRVVRVGLADRLWAEIEEGVEAGDEVVVVGAQGLVAGAPLAPSPWAGAQAGSQP